MSATREIVRRYAARRVPRYTSYPTAAEFKADVGFREQAAWLGTVAPGDPVSIYLHVPYCRELCHYCGCNAKGAVRADVIHAYRSALETEIDRVCDLMPDKATVGRIHWGGGTPSILGADGLKSVTVLLNRRCAIQSDAEHAIELDPRYVTQDLTQALRAIGVNRASLGVQDTDPRVQLAIGRWQPFKNVEQAAGHLRAAGIAHLNFDLIYGLPAQTTASLEATCRMVAQLSPDRIACYGYAHVPQMRANQRLIDADSLPDSDERSKQAEVIAAQLRSAGYTQIGLDHFVKPRDSLALAARSGRLRRNFQGYTDDPSQILIGFGASAISRFDAGYAQNIADPPSYVRAIEAGRLAAHRGIRMDAFDHRRARIIESLMCQFWVDLDQIAPDESFASELQSLQTLVADGCVSIEGRLISVAPWARSIVRVVAAAFDPHMQAGTERFSKAV